MERPKNQLKKLRSLHHSLGEVLAYVEHLEGELRNSVASWEYRDIVKKNKELEEENKLLSIQNRKLLLESIGYEPDTTPVPPQQKESKEVIPFEDVKNFVNKEISKGE